jgi:L-malate glycosyltransferase
MRVAYVVDSLAVGGSELAALRTFALLRARAEIHVFHMHRDGPLRREYLALGARLSHVETFGIRDPRNVGVFIKFRRSLASIGAEVVHSHDSYSNMLVLASQLPVANVSWISSRRWLDQIVRPSHARLNRIAFRRAAAVTVNSRTVAEHMVARERIAPSQIEVIPNFVEPLVEWHGAPSDHHDYITIGMVSRLTPIKRHDLAIRAVRQLIDTGVKVRLHIVGDGEARAGIERLVGELQLQDCVTLVGERRGGPSLYTMFDIGLSTSDSEGSPNSVLEAMAAGRPVVGTDAGGTRDLLRDGVDGFVVPVGEVDALTDALRRLVRDRDLRKSLGRNAYRRAVSDFSPDAIAVRLMALYERVK